VERNKIEGKRGIEETGRKAINYERHTTKGEKEKNKEGKE
jgi:hypothetical protein